MPTVRQLNFLGRPPRVFTSRNQWTWKDQMYPLNAQGTTNPTIHEQLLSFGDIPGGCIATEPRFKSIASVERHGKVFSDIEACSRKNKLSALWGSSAPSTVTHRAQLAK